MCSNTIVNVFSPKKISLLAAMFGIKFFVMYHKKRDCNKTFAKPGTQKNKLFIQFFPPFSLSLSLCSVKNTVDYIKIMYTFHVQGKKGRN